jgi:integrase
MTGSLQTKNGMFYIVLNLKEDGKRKQKWVKTDLPVARNKKRAEQLLRETLERYERQTAAVTGTMLFADWMRHDLENGCKSRVDAVSHADYVKVTERHLIPWFEARKITVEGLTCRIVQEFVDEKSTSGRLDGKGGLGAQSVKHIKNMVSMFMTAAVREELVSSNPCTQVIIPKKTTRPPSYYSAEEVANLLELIKSTTLYPLVYMSSLYGLRRSELLGLKWGAIDFHGKAFTIQHTAVQAYGKIYRKDGTKNKSSRRTLPLLPDAERILLEIRRKEAENRLLLGKGYADNDYVFKRENGEPYTPDWACNTWRAALKRHNLRPIRFHDLRHSCASLLIARGFGIKDVQEWLGHANISNSS